MTARAEIREPDPASYDALVRLQLDRIPTLRRGDAEFLFVHGDMFVFRHLRTAHVDGALAGWGCAFRPPHFPPDFCVVGATVARDHERRGVGRALFRDLVAALPAMIAMVGTGVRDDDPDSLAIALAHGFQRNQHGIESELELVDLPEPIPIPGVTYEDVSDLIFPDEGAVEAMLVDSQTNPEAEQGFVTRLADLRRFTGSAGRPLAVLARLDGAPAAIISGDIKDDVLGIAYTGVGRAFRGRSLAFALKQYAHRIAAANGATLSRTTNEEGNGGIRHVNAKLGYRVVGGMYRLRRPRGDRPGPATAPAAR